MVLNPPWALCKTVCSFNCTLHKTCCSTGVLPQVGRNCDLRTAAALLWWACITCPLCHPPVETSEVRIREVRAVHTEWERCPSTTELRGPLQKSPSQGWPGHKRTHSLINKDTSEQSELSKCCFIGKLTCFSFLMWFQPSTKRLFQFWSEQSELKKPLGWEVKCLKTHWEHHGGYQSLLRRWSWMQW